MEAFGGVGATSRLVAGAQGGADLEQGLHERAAEAVSRAVQFQADALPDPSGGHDDQVVGQEYRLLDAVGHQKHALVVGGAEVEQVLLERFPEEPAPTGASLSAGAGRAAAAVLAGAGQAVGPIPAGEGQPTAPAPAPPEVALAAYLRERRLRLRHDSVAVPDANALEEELKDFIGAVAGEPLAGASGTEGLRSLTTALEIHRRVQESLSLLGLEDLPPAS